MAEAAGAVGTGIADVRAEEEASDDEQDRYGQRSRSQEGRWARDRDDRDRRDRYAEPPLGIPSATIAIREAEKSATSSDPKADRVSHEPPAAAKDVPLLL